jgi:hypothetical protein
MLHTFKESAGEENWNNYVEKFPEDLKRAMLKRFEC